MPGLIGKWIWEIQPLSFDGLEIVVVLGAAGRCCVYGENPGMPLQPSVQLSRLSNSAILVDDLGPQEKPYEEHDLPRGARALLRSSTSALGKTSDVLLANVILSVYRVTEATVLGY